MNINSTGSLFVAQLSLSGGADLLQQTLPLFPMWKLRPCLKPSLFPCYCVLAELQSKSPFKYTDGRAPQLVIVESFHTFDGAASNRL